VAAEGDGLIEAFNYRENKKAIIPDELKQRILDLESFRYAHRQILPLSYDRG